MEVTVRLMVVIVMILIVMMVALTVIFSMGGEAMSGVTGLFDWIRSMMSS
jgi:hypothetical protein